MPIIIDALGEREVSDEELQGCYDQAERDWAAFTAGLTWQPIAAYDSQAGATVLLRQGETWEIGYWGEWPPEDDDRRMWRAAKDWKMGEPLGFAPEAFAIVSDERRVHLIAD